MKEKAKELVDAFYYCGMDKNKCHNPIYVITRKKAKKCALICVDFALSIGVSPLDTKELKEIKQEINNL